MSSLESITRFVVPAVVAEDTDARLREAGRDRVERFVLWSGVHDDDTFNVRTAHIPRQIAYRFPEGLCVRVDGSELHRVNLWLFRHQEMLGIQVHSHPNEAFHSDTDDTYPIVTVRGGLSLVVPEFGRAGVRGKGVAWYRLGASSWEELSPADAKRLVQFEE